MNSNRKQKLKLLKRWEEILYQATEDYCHTSTGCGQTPFRNDMIEARENVTRLRSELRIK